MQKLIAGLHRFQEDIFREQRELFHRLVSGQSPEALFVTCSDSRINPALITQTEPGELFVLRNAGNLIPPYGSGSNGEAATIEFAVAVLGVKDIIVCGHSHCGAVQAAFDRAKTSDLPALRHWLIHAESTRRIIDDNYQHLSGDAKISAAVAENVLVQLEHLRTHPVVHSRLAKGLLKLHGWVYKFETGEVFNYDHSQSQFVSLERIREGLP